MSPSARIGIIGDRNPEHLTHPGTDHALRHAANYLGIHLRTNWIATPSLDEGPLTGLQGYDGFLCAPGSPYKSMHGALKGIQFARQSNLPFLGTCGRFQHMVIEFARNVVGVPDAEHAEEHPESPRPFITPLACSLSGKTEKVRILPDTCAADVYGKNEIEEKFHCNFGVNPAYRSIVEEHGLCTSGVDFNGEIRISELPSHPFFMGTLFLPQMNSAPKQPHPLLLALLEEAT